MHHGGLTRTMASGSPNGPRREAFDRWFRYPAGFGEVALTATLAALGDAPGLVVDPFAGVATAARPLGAIGWKFRGIEAHPEIAELAALKVAAPVDAESLEAEARRVVELAADGDVAGEHPIIAKAFPPHVLEALVGLRNAIGGQETSSQPLLKWALLATLRDVAAVKVGWPYQRPSVERKAPYSDARSRFLERVERMAQDLRDHPTGPDARIVCGDSRRPEPWAELLGSERADACISSPPYLNNYDYADATRLELYFWGTVRSWRSLTSIVRAEMVTASTQQTSVAAAEDAEAVIQEWDSLGEEILDLTHRLTAQRRHRPRGKEYDRLIPMYFTDLMAVIEQARANLVSDGVLAWVVGDSAPYGVYVDTPRILSKMAERVGFSQATDLHLRARGNRWFSNGSRHSVELSERLIVLRAPGPRAD